MPEVGKQREAQAETASSVRVASVPLPPKGKHYGSHLGSPELQEGERQKPVPGAWGQVLGLQAATRVRRARRLLWELGAPRVGVWWLSS